MFPLISVSLSQIDFLYDLYLKDPTQLEASWFYFFEGMSFAEQKTSIPTNPVKNLIEAYRIYGYLMAHTDPLQEKPEEAKELALERFNLTLKDLQKEYPTEHLFPEKVAPLSQIIDKLKTLYTGSIAYEFKHMHHPELERFIEESIEHGVSITQEEKKQLFTFLMKAEVFENFLHTKYVGQKRFSLEGTETLIPLLQFILSKGAERGVNEVIIGMAHRGRLNVLTNIAEKPYAHLFSEFEDLKAAAEQMSGDVKYHKGFQSRVTTLSGHPLTVLVAYNPSHLEAVDPVVEGMTRALQDQQKQGIMPVIIHGDSSISGQGVVYETLQMYGLPGYQTQGTIHIIVNNQVGFTALPSEARSTRYCTDIGKAFSFPIFHVNAEDPLACVKVARLAVEIRQKFQIDVFIDLQGYRKYGHNEGDEPGFTLPSLYKKIREKKTIKTLFVQQLIQESLLSEDEVHTLEETFKQTLQSSQKNKKEITSFHHTISPLKIAPLTLEKAQELTDKLYIWPPSFEAHPKIKKMFQERKKTLEATTLLDWAQAELLAYATLLDQNINIRLSGQDSERGTFSHRHSVLHDQSQKNIYVPLRHLSKEQGHFQVYNSFLSEYAVLGFEYGYSLGSPNTLVLWEAQFGDFANGAQIIIDQFLSAGEQKWGETSSLTLLLPHGYEGQGPEHSSARLERFLQLCAQDNMRVVNPTTPAQLFHVLRRQVSSERKPLILFTPKALLRHPLCISPLKEFISSSFQPLLFEEKNFDTAEILYFCSGKVYYDLYQEREKRQTKNLALVRLEQLYPLDTLWLVALKEKYKRVKTWGWVQEEPQNMGAWSFIVQPLEEWLGVPLHYRGRPASASPATGSLKEHHQQQMAFINALFT